MDQASLGRRLKRLRDQRHLGQDEVAAAVDLHVQTVSRHERGATMLSVIDAIAYATFYGVSLDELVGRKAPTVVGETRDTQMHFLHPPVLERVLRARSIDDYNALAITMIPWGFVAEPGDQLVAAVVFDETERRVEAVRNRLMNRKSGSRNQAKGPESEPPTGQTSPVPPE